VEDNPNSEGIAVTPEDEIIEMAIENTINGLTFNQDGLVRFAKMIAEKEREACAKVCEDYGRAEEMQAIGNDYATAIRARGQA